MVFASKFLHQTCILAAVCHAALHTTMNATTTTDNDTLTTTTTDNDTTTTTTTTMTTSSADMLGSGWDCSVPTGYSIKELQEVQYRNCKKVGDTVKDFAQAKKWFSCQLHAGWCLGTESH
mmetsp:Transcript_33830/g.60989  ORF Transcript_33830/g.60989 Transcript_33830/m.60989 type:complete len:120 (+) Transcript_33830:91-450(+)